MKPPIYSKQPRPAIGGGYICDGCGKVVSSIGCDGQRFICHDCQVKQEQQQEQPEATENA